MADITAMTASRASTDTGGVTRSTKSNDSLDMTDFLTLMVAQFQNQTMDNTASTSDMLNQLVMMQAVTAISNITDATVMMYAGSLVGKEVTVGQYDKEGKLQEIVGTVTGTGMAGGQQVIFVDGKSYYLSDIMAIGRLPEIEDPENPDGGDGSDGGDGVEDPEKPGEGGSTEKPGEGGDAGTGEDSTPPEEGSR